MSFEKIIDVPRLNRFKTKILNLVYKKDEVYNKNEIDNKFSQNAFSKVTVGSTTVAADSKADTLTLVAGSNVTITPDATNDKITIAAKDTTYSSKAAVSGGTDVSLVTTGEKATWNAKTSNTGTITQVKANGTSIATSGVANIPAASTSAYGVTKLTSDLTGNSESLAATQKAVNTLNSNFSNYIGIPNYDNYYNGTYSTGEDDWHKVDKTSLVKVQAERDDIGYLRVQLAVKSSENSVTAPVFNNSMYNHEAQLSMIHPMAVVPKGGYYKCAYVYGNSATVTIFPLE